MDKGFYSVLTGITDTSNKYEDLDDMKSTTDEKKVVVKTTKKNCLGILHLYQTVDTSRDFGYLAKMCSD